MDDSTLAEQMAVGWSHRPHACGQMGKKDNFLERFYLANGTRLKSGLQEVETGKMVAMGDRIGKSLQEVQPASMAGAGSKQRHLGTTLRNIYSR